MTDAINRCSADETAACCCVDVGTVLDNKDCTASYQHVFATQGEAESMLKMLTEKAKSVESEPCAINHTFKQVNGGVELSAEFSFSCEAESLIFQLGLR
ncbi:YfcZ/YiiS family protein [Providencia vermicola]|uniref:YfcZ/YiiS family protein n=1 Tax=Providencia TaxID=586 RepID=UPI000A6D2117|nr:MULTISPECIES: YfcZ/YiiS family protein [Providencia]MBN4863610.1 YfcZ/YiiS family protein [Providencia stuartii]MBN4872932.1 YfcZ/YiiS family protein [Providencia stuartii]MBN4877947.1 YfcZ/YiiS family protein [Providencia stuartii]MBN4882133.1 YfcZ/YiiS family protein [Providencia stuartii]USR63496.1 YfcZ/YiiS family protein [Providencia stuartii]